MHVYFLFASFVLGAIAGSFINALLYRFNTGRGMGGRSHCDVCGHTLGVGDLVPIFSYLFLQGRCRYCRARISIQNLIIEIIAGTLAVLVAILYFEPLSFLFWFVVWMLLLFIVVYDLRHTIIPWSCSIMLGILALASLVLHFDDGITFIIPTVWELLAGPLLALPLFLLSFISGGRWMGWADSGIELSLGWILGLSLGASGLMLAFWSGAAVGLVLMLFSKLRWHGSLRRFTIGSEIPFAPFLALGAFIAFFFHVDLFSSLTLLW